MSDTLDPTDLAKLTKADLIERLVATTDALGRQQLAAAEHTGAEHPKPHYPLDDLERRTYLRAIPDTWADPPRDWIAKLPRGGTTLDYLGHADTTLALINVDPEWRFDLGWNTAAGPVDPFVMGKAVLLAEMTVLGVTRPCVGTIPDASVSREAALKELVSDAIRNGAMRFGIATGLWSKAQRAGTPDLDTAGTTQRPQEAPQAPAAPEPLPEGRITVADAKRRLLEGCAGDKECAREAWALADFTTATIHVGIEDVHVVDETAVNRFLIDLATAAQETSTVVEAPTESLPAPDAPPK